MVGRRSLVAFLVLSVLGPIFFDYPHRLQADVTTESAVVPRAYIPFVAKNMWIGTTTMSGTANVDNLSVAGGSTLRTIGDTTINAQGSVNIGGELLTDGGRLTINALGDVLITGVITPTVFTRTGNSSGHVEITGRNITVLASDPSRVVIKSLGDLTLRTATVTGTGLLQPQGEGDFHGIYMGGSLSVSDGVDGNRDTEQEPTDGSSIYFYGPVRVDGTRGGRIEIRAGRGGAWNWYTFNGADDCPGRSFSAVGGHGRKGGSIAMGYASSLPDSPTSPVTLVGDVWIYVGDGGSGEGFLVFPGNGSGPGCSGGSATVTGGNGGKAGSFRVPPGTTWTEGYRQTYVDRGDGGQGGMVLGGKGIGADGAFPNHPDGSPGGNFNLQGGAGGEAGDGDPGGLQRYGYNGTATLGYDLFNRDIDTYPAGNGGKGANGCPWNLQGGNGGSGGAVSLRGGINARGRTDIGWWNVANGGPGGPGTTPGAGGAAGFGGEMLGNAESAEPSFQPGAPGGVCPTITAPASVTSKEWFTLRLDLFPPNAVIEIDTFKHGIRTLTFEVTVDANGRHEGLHWLSTCGGNNTIELKARIKGQSEVMAQTQILVMGDPACTP